ncbi:MAG: heat-inducible transcription repressor HrcA [Anaerolineales bacterium]|nr:heat-inducible transcription repressor HrcA [Anaerolineales bacterium]
MTEISERQETILALIVHDYIETAEPVGSKKLIQTYNLGISSATVRNDMAALTSVGLLRQPHTSAGRVPTEDGYRYFVRRLLLDTDLPIQEKRLIQHQFHQANADMDEWVHLAASVLAHHSKAASVVSSPHTERSIFKHLELISTRVRQILMVLVLHGGDVRQQMLTLARPFSQDDLSRIARQISNTYQGKDAREIRQSAHNLDVFIQEIVDLILEVMERADAVSAGVIHYDGLAHMLAEPEFARSESAQHALRILEERSFLEEVLAKALSPQIGGVEVVIGGEGAWEELKDCSMVLARYGAPGYATGAVGILGPTRMAYGRTISTVRYVAGLMSDLVLEAYSE